MPAVGQGLSLGVCTPAAGQGLSLGVCTPAAGQGSTWAVVFWGRGSRQGTDSDNAEVQIIGFQTNRSILCIGGENRSREVKCITQGHRGGVRHRNRDREPLASHLILSH